MHDHRIEIIDHQICYEGFFRLERYRLRHRLFSGEWGPIITRELLARGHAAAVLPYDPVLDEVVLIEQFRIGALAAPGGAWLLEVVAGIIEEEESPETVVRREAEEEAGCVIGELVPICDYLVSPGGTSERLFVFCGRVDASAVGGIHGLADEGEDIRVTSVAAEQAFRYLDAGRIESATPIIALQWLRLNRQALRARWLGSARD